MISRELALGAQERLTAFLDQIGAILRNKKRKASFAMYAVGLLADGERKSAEPIAARACGDPERANAVHLQLIHFLASSPWEDRPIREAAGHYTVDAMQTRDPVRTWIIDDTGFLKQGKHSPGVQRQYTGSAGKTTNCQIGVSLVLANAHTQVPVDFRLYLPKSWTEDRPRCRRAHIPDEVEYSPKWRLGLDMIESAVQAGFPTGIVLADCGYGNTAAFRHGLDELGLQYAVEVQGPTVVRRIGADGKPGERISVKQLGRCLKSQFRKVTWREGTKQTLQSRFARVRVVVDGKQNVERPSHQWLVIEWPEAEAAPTKFVLCTMAKKTSMKQMVLIFKSRWRTERAYEDLKGELGLDHFEGRSFPGWHHHVTVAICCYAFVVAEQARSFPPSAGRTPANDTLQYAA